MLYMKMMLLYYVFTDINMENTELDQSYDNNKLNIGIIDAGGFVAVGVAKI